jgi:molybdopterin converting factor small subunit
LIEVRLPPTLQEYANEAGPERIEARSLVEAMELLKRDYPSLFRCICDETGSIRRHIHIFINSKQVYYSVAAKDDIPLHAGDKLMIWTAVSGG